MRQARETGAARLGISLFDASLCLVNSCLTVHGRVRTVGSPMVTTYLNSPRSIASWSPPATVAAQPLALTDATAAPMPTIDEGKERSRIPTQRRSNK
jgi:hypothetical protein